MSAAVAAAAAAALANRSNSANTSAFNTTTTNTTTKYNYKSYTRSYHFPIPPTQQPCSLGLFELQKSQDWDTFDQYIKSRHQHGLPALSMRRCSGAHVVEFLIHLDKFGETKIHNKNCAFYGHVHATAACSCPLKKAWTSLEAMVKRLRAAFEEHGGAPENNPFRSPEVWLYLMHVKKFQAKARGQPWG